MRMIVSGLLMMAAPAGAATMAVGALQALVEGFAGQAAVVDPRLLVPACAAPALARVGTSVAVRCAAPVWEVFVPLAGAATVPVPAAPVLVRRGDRVVVEADGAGFVVALEAVAEQDARDGRVPVRAGSRRFVATVDAGGRVRIHGLNGMVNGR